MTYRQNLEPQALIPAILQAPQILTFACLRDDPTTSLRRARSDVTLSARGPVENCQRAPAQRCWILATKVVCTYNRATHKTVLLMKTNVTLKLDSELLREVKILAAQNGSSISAMLSDSLERLIRDRASYAEARKRAQARLRKGMDLGWTPARSRDELHER